MSGDGDVLPGLLRRLAVEAPERPWLFYPEGLDWRWLARREVAERMERGAETLAERLGRAGVEEGGAVAFAAPPVPGTVILDLALQAAGYRPVPRAAGPTAAGPTTGGEEVRAGVLVRPGPGRPDPRWPDFQALEIKVLEPAAPPAPPRPADLVAAARRLAGQGEGEGPAALPPAPRPRGGHEVTVAGHPFESAGQRLLVAWSLVTGGALVLEDQPGARVATAAWARPTLFLGTVEELERLAREAEDFERGDLTGRLRRGLDRLLHRFIGRDRRPVLPFRRLHTVVRSEGGPPPGDPAAAELHRRRGARVLRLEDLLP